MHAECKCRLDNGNGADVFAIVCGSPVPNKSERSGDSGNELCRDNSKGMKRWYSADEDQTESHLEKKKE